MSENYQNSITDQICKVQTSKKLIALYDRLRYPSRASPLARRVVCCLGDRRREPRRAPGTCW